MKKNIENGLLERDFIDKYEYNTNNMNSIRRSHKIFKKSLN